MPSLSRRPSGEPAVGELFELFDETSQSRVTIAPERGGLVTSFSVQGRELLYLDPATLNDAAKNVRGGVPVLFPTPGKLEQDSWHWGDHGGKLHQHGFARNLPFRVVKPDEAQAEIVLQLDSSAATLAVYPWEFRFELTFQLAGARLRIGSRVENRSAQVMPFALGYHPYFLVPDKAHVAVDAHATRAFNNVTKAVTPFTGFDWTAPEVDLHLLDSPRSSAALEFSKRNPADTGGRLALSASPDFSVWVVWTLAGKDYVCVEPWTAPGNALNTGERLIQLPPGVSHSSFFDLAWLAR